MPTHGVTSSPEPEDLNAILARIARDQEDVRRFVRQANAQAQDQNETQQVIRQINLQTARTLLQQERMSLRNPRTVAIITMVSMVICAIALLLNLVALLYPGLLQSCTALSL